MPANIRRDLIWGLKG